MPITRRDFAMALAMAAAASKVFAQGASAATGNDDVVLRAMRDELERSRQLRIVGGGDDAPYFISYDLTDADNFRVSASMGALVNTGRSRFRVPSMEVRVGNYDFDHTGHIFSGIYTGSRYDSDWPLDDDYAAMREALWLGTDRAYKTALESMARKRATLNNSNAPSEKLADFSQAPAIQSIGNTSHKKLDEATWTARVVKLSGLFNSYKEILASDVQFQVIDGVSYLVNSEGTAIRYSDNVTFLNAKAEGQAADGMLVHDAVTFEGLQSDQIPPEAELQKAITELAGNIRALVNAPMGDATSGPTLFEPQAAAQLMAHLLGDNLRLPRKPIADPGRAVNFLASELETKVGSRILPDWIDVVDDPTQSTWKGKPLVGYYPFDLEGVPGKPVNVIEKGAFKNFLTTRQPVKGFPASNGHARLPGNYGSRTAGISNLFVNASQTVPLADLKKRLIDLCKDRGKPYGMLVRKLDYPFSGSGSDIQALASAGAQSGGSARPVSPPILVYRVYPDGREELVRGLRFRGLSTRNLRDLLAASQETAVFQFVNNSAPLAYLGVGGVLSPAAVIAPALLFDEIELERPQEPLPRPPVVPSPNTGS